MRYFVESYGCTMNYGEGEQLSRKMDSLGYTRVDSVDEADIVILNTCTVVETTEKNMIRRMGDLKSKGKKVIVTGCMAKVQPKRITIRLPDSLIVPPAISRSGMWKKARDGTGSSSWAAVKRALWARYQAIWLCRMRLRLRTRISFNFQFSILCFQFIDVILRRFC